MRELSLTQQLIIGILIGFCFMIFFFSLPGCSDVPDEWCVADTESWVPWAEGTIRSKQLVDHPEKYYKGSRKVIELIFEDDKKVLIGHLRDFDTVKEGQTGILYKHHKYDPVWAWFQWIQNEENMKENQNAT